MELLIVFALILLFSIQNHQQGKDRVATGYTARLTADFLQNQFGETLFAEVPLIRAI